LSRAVYVITRLGLPDALAAGPRPLGELADEVGANADFLGRVVRTLAMVGVFRTGADGVVALGPLGRALVADEPQSVRDLTLVVHETQWDVFGELLECVKQGRPAVDICHGESYWSVLERDPAQAERFTRAMADVTATVETPLLALYDIGDPELVVDVGGADGEVLVQLLARAPGARGIVFDLPHIVPAAATVVEAHGMSDRVELVGGSFFDSVPAGGDRYMISTVLHDWADDEVDRILANVRAAIRPDGRLAVVEHLVPEGDEPHFAKILDLTILAILTGRERTEAEWAVRFRKAGFEPERTISAGTGLSLIEAVPV
jgi:hypothetical protein